MGNVTIHLLDPSSTNSLYHEFAIFNQNNGTTEKLTLLNILNTELNSLYTANKAIPNAINLLHTDISNIQDVLGNTTDLDGYDITSLIVGNSDSIRNINTSLGSINTSLGTINGNIDTINGSIDTINGSIDTINGNINSLDSKINNVIKIDALWEGRFYYTDQEITISNNSISNYDYIDVYYQCLRDSSKDSNVYGPCTRLIRFKTDNIRSDTKIAPYIISESDIVDTYNQSTSVNLNMRIYELVITPNEAGNKLTIQSAAQWSWSGNGSGNATYLKIDSSTPTTGDGAQPHMRIIRIDGIKYNDFQS